MTIRLAMPYRIAGGSRASASTRRGAKLQRMAESLCGNVAPKELRERTCARDNGHAVDLEQQATWHHDHSGRYRWVQTGPDAWDIAKERR